MNPFPTEDSDLDAALASAFADLKKYPANSDEYARTVDQIVKLKKLQTDMSKLNLELHVADAKILADEGKAAFEYEQADLPFYKRISPDTALIVAGNIVIGLAVIKYEQTGVIATRVKDFVKKI